MDKQYKDSSARVDKFKIVIFDFADVEEIGQAFADQVYRVFKRHNPDITLATINANKQIQQMITRAETNNIQLTFQRFYKFDCNQLRVFVVTQLKCLT